MTSKVKVDMVSLWVIKHKIASEDAQIFKRSDFREKIEDGSLGLLPPEPG